MLVYMALSLPKIAGGSWGAVTPQAAPGQRPGGRPPWNNNPPLKNAFIEKQYIRQKRKTPTYQSWDLLAGLEMFKARQNLSA